MSEELRNEFQLAWERLAETRRRYAQELRNEFQSTGPHCGKMIPTDIGLVPCARIAGHAWTHHRDREPRRTADARKEIEWLEALRSL